MQKKKRVLTLRNGLTLIFALIFLLSGGMLIRDLCRSSREQAANQALIQRVEQSVPSMKPLPANSNRPVDVQTTPKPEPERNYQPLLQENDDLAAWLLIQGTEINYPVMYTPDDPEYYLRKAFDGSYALSGSLFIGADCVPDGTNIIIYGHKMNDGSMFGGLNHYAEESYAREHPEIIYDLILEDGSYQRFTFDVMAAFYSRIYRMDEENVFRYYYGTDLSEVDDYQTYVEQALSASLYDLGVRAEYGDRLLTLSTCSYHTDEGRFVVVAREKSAGP